MKRLALLVALIMGLTLGVAAVAAAHTLGKPAKNTFYVVGGSESAKEVGYKDGLKRLRG